MEKANIDNKLRKMMDNLEGQFKILNQMVPDSIDMAVAAKRQVLKGMSTKQKAKHKAFEAKYISLTKKGRVKDAEELKNKYLNE